MPLSLIHVILTYSFIRSGYMNLSILLRQDKPHGITTFYSSQASASLDYDLLRIGS
jgi:hypothetical protein